MARIPTDSPQPGGVVGFGHAGWLKRFPIIDKAVDRFGYWLGFFGSVGTAMTWLINQTGAITQYGWAALILAGIGATCIIVLVVSVFLVAFRYFNPIAKPEPGKVEAEDPAKALSVMNSEWEKTLFGFGKHLDELIIDHASLRIEFATIGPVVAQLQHLRRTAFLLTTAAKYEFFAGRLCEAKKWWESHPRLGPFETNDQIQAETKRVEDFIGDLRANIGESHWGEELYRVIAQAEDTASHEIKNMTVPDGLNPFFYRDLHIACMKYERIGAFLERSVVEARNGERQNYELIRDQIKLHK